MHNKAAELGQATASPEDDTTAEGEARYFFSSTADTDPVHKTRQGTCPFLYMILPQVHLRKPCYDFYFL